MDKENLAVEMETLTKLLVSVPSVNSEGFGERDMACAVETYLRALPYFQQHPEQVIVQHLKDDPHDRRNVFALLRGEKAQNADTVILHGHMDTVGVEDYGELEPYAFSCEELASHMAQADLPEEAHADLESGEWLFGRGAGDMKGGDAVFLVLAKYLGERVRSFSGNLLLSFQPVEENAHTGILEALEVFSNLQQRLGLNYVLAINNDYICPLLPGDTTRYVYTGAVGKLLPCFYIQGRETHVGQCFEGFNATLAAAELVRTADLNCDFCEGYRGEYTLPPTALKMTDLKEQYNVQTPQSAFVYFNYFVHDASMKEITGKLCAAAQHALQFTAERTAEQHRRYAALTGDTVSTVPESTQVLLYRELFAKAEQHFDGNLQDAVETFAAQLQRKGTDTRDIALQTVRRLCRIAGFQRPTAVLFFAAPYCPHNTLHPDAPQQAETYRKLAQAVQTYSKTSGVTYRILQFFPSLSDSSYLSIDDDEASIQTLTENFPAYHTLYPLPFDTIRRLSIPAVDFGCLCKDAHKWTERVHKPYSFEVLPELILQTLQTFLKFDV